MGAGHTESTHSHDEGTNSRRERERDEMGLLKGTINTQLSQNLLSPQFQVSAVADFAIKFKYVNVLIYSVGLRLIRAEGKTKKCWLVVRDVFWMLGNASVLSVAITQLPTNLNILKHNITDLKKKKKSTKGKQIFPELAATLFGGKTERAHSCSTAYNPSSHRTVSAHNHS